MTKQDYINKTEYLIFDFISLCRDAEPWDYLDEKDEILQEFYKGVIPQAQQDGIDTAELIDIWKKRVGKYI